MIKKSPKRRGRPKGSKNKTLSPWRRVHRLSETLPDPVAEEFNYDTLRDDFGVLAPKDEDLQEELDLMGTKLN